MHVQHVRYLRRLKTQIGFWWHEAISANSLVRCYLSLLPSICQVLDSLRRNLQMIGSEDTNPYDTRGVLLGLKPHSMPGLTTLMHFEYQYIQPRLDAAMPNRGNADSSTAYCVTSDRRQGASHPH